MTPELLAAWEEMVRDAKEHSGRGRVEATILAADAELEALRQLRSQISTALGFVSNEVLIATAHGYRKEREDLRAQVTRLVDALNKMSCACNTDLCIRCTALASPTAQSSREWLEAVKRKAYKEGAAAAWSRAAEFEVDPQFKQEYRDRAAALLKEAATKPEGRDAK